MTQLLTQNSKMKKSKEKIWNFGIPAYQSQSGFKTCPNAGACAIGCYARSGAYMFSNVKTAFEYRLEVSQSNTFVCLMQTEIDKKQVKFLRIHDSGDFYDKEYLFKWMSIMHSNPNTLFYAYTKQVKMFKELAFLFPKNFVYIYSFGGLQDSLIDVTKDRHSMVFPSVYALRKAGYVNTSNEDSPAFKSINHRIGLVFHHTKNIENTSWSAVLKKNLLNKKEVTL